MIIIKKPMRATIAIAISLSKEQQKLLAGDIENWLQTKKGIICQTQVK